MTKSTRDALYLYAKHLTARHAVTVSYLHMICNSLLGNVERQSKVATSIFWIQSGVVERFRVEVMNESTERHTVCPARREVRYIHMLQTNIQEI